MFVLVIKVHLQAHTVLRLAALETHRRTDVRPLVEVAPLQLRRLVQLVLSQDQFLQVVENVSPLVLYGLGVFGEVGPFVLEFFDEVVPLFFLLGGGAGEVDAVGVVDAFALGDGSVDLWFGDGVGETYDLFEVEEFSAELYSLELIDEIQELHFVLELDLHELLFHTFDDAQCDQHYSHLLLADDEIPESFDEL